MGSDVTPRVNMGLPLLAAASCTHRLSEAAADNSVWDQTTFSEKLQFLQHQMHQMATSAPQAQPQHQPHSDSQSRSKLRGRSALEPKS